MNLRVLWAPLIFLTSLQAPAADIAREVVTSSDRSDAYAELSLSFHSIREPIIGFNNQDNLEESSDTQYGIGISIDGRFRYKKVFLEFVEDSFSNLSLGYILTNSDKGSVELIATNVFDNVDRKNIAGLESITERENDANVGIRSSIYRGENIIQVELITDVSGSHGGVIGSLQLGRQKQIRNWNLHGLVGVRYFSDKVIDHYFGVSAAESTTDIAEYRADGGVLPSVQIGATLPLNEKWLFKTQAKYFHLPDSVSDSPLAQGNAVYSAQVGVSYIFGGR